MATRQPQKRGAKISFKNLSNPWQRFRSQTGMSQDRLAAALNVSQAAVSAYETRRRAPLMSVSKRFLALAALWKIRMSLAELYADG